jgi:peptidoglycan/xylan/chitin deacetylase (PgdA/CDA1 family)
LKRLGIITILFAVLIIPVFGEVKFFEPDLSADNNLLFGAEVSVPEYGTYKTLFLSNLDKESITQLTFFPERVVYLKGTGQLQIQNRFGVFRSTTESVGMNPVKAFPSFAEGTPVKNGKILPLLASPDGKYLLFLRPESAAFGALVLRNLVDDEETVISKRAELSLDGPAASWAPDSKYFIYEKNDALYYFSTSQLEADRVVDERFRLLGEGTINSIRWSGGSQLYYLSGSLLYEIHSSEFFTHSIYQDLLTIGKIIGKVPFLYDPNFDSFWISPDGKKLLFNRDGRNLLFYFLRADDFFSTGDILTLPYLFLPRNTSIKRVLWSAGDTVTILARSIKGGNIESDLFRLKIDKAKPAIPFTRIEGENITDIILSPDETKVALLGEESVTIRNYLTWNREAGYDHQGPISAIWRDSDSLIIAGRSTTELINHTKGDRSIICLSQPAKYGFSEGGKSILVASGDTVLSYGVSEGDWEPASVYTVSPRITSSEDYRVYLESLTSGNYINIVMVRKIKELGTTALFKPPEKKYEPFPEEDEPVNLHKFTHGSRIRRRELSLVFNAVHSNEGLPVILNTLADYGITATFFVNGDFIRRHPGAVKEIADSGHEVGSLFFTYFNMAESRYKITGDFVRQGLARNEDEYFEKTGNELSLLWHAPHYFDNEDIIYAAEKMNYTYIGRDVDSLDWVPRRTDSGIPNLYMSAPELVERILELKKPGSIVSMTVGKPNDSDPAGGRDDYLFDHLGLLINGLLDLGYTIVPVTTLMEHVK